MEDGLKSRRLEMSETKTELTVSIWGCRESLVLKIGNCYHSPQHLIIYPTEVLASQSIYSHSRKDLTRLDYWASFGAVHFYTPGTAMMFLEARFCAGRDRYHAKFLFSHVVGWIIINDALLKLEILGP